MVKALAYKVRFAWGHASAWLYNVAMVEACACGDFCVGAVHRLAMAKACAYVGACMDLVVRCGHGKCARVRGEACGGGARAWACLRNVAMAKAQRCIPRACEAKGDSGSQSAARAHE